MRRMNNCIRLCQTKLEVMNVSYLQDLPIGFGMALLQNRQAAMYFDSLPEAQRQHIISQTHGINSKEEMQAFVDKLRTR